MLQTWELEGNMYDGDIAAGPVPTYFSEDLEGTRANMEASLARLHSDGQRLARAFFMPETVTIEEAAPIIKKPR